MDEKVADRINFAKQDPTFRKKVRMSFWLEIGMLVMWLGVLVPVMAKPKMIFDPSDIYGSIGLISIFILALMSELIVLNGIRYLYASLRGYLKILIGVSAIGVVMFFNPLTLGFGTQTRDGIIEAILLALFFVYYIGSKLYIMRVTSRIIKAYDDQLNAITPTI